MDHYTAFGLTIASELVLPELLAAPPGATPDVTICLGPTPADLPGATGGLRHQATHGRYLFRLPSVGGFFVVDGRSVTIDPAPEIDAESLRAFLLGPIFGALLRQRGLLVLHGSAVATPHGAALFCAPSGCGKSTLAAALAGRGYAMLADDLCAMMLAADQPPRLLPAFPRLSLWADALKRVAHADPQSRLRPALEKYRVAVGDFRADPLPVAVIYSLTPQNARELSITTLHGFAKIQELTAQTYGRITYQPLQPLALHFAQVGMLAGSTPLRRVTRPRELFLLDELADLIEGDLRA